MQKIKKARIFLLSALIAIGLIGCQTTANTGKNLKSQAPSHPKFALTQNLCASGVAEACLDLAHIYLTEDKTVEASLKSQGLLVRACNLGTGDGCYGAAEFYEQHFAADSEVDLAGGWYIAAQNYYDEECSAGKALSCFNSANMSYDGKKVRKDMEAAIAGYEKACDMKLAKACTNLATLHMNEKDGYLDRDRAVSLFQKACDGEDELACTKLGVLYSTGFGIDRDPDAGRKYFDEACRLKPSTRFCQMIRQDNRSS